MLLLTLQFDYLIALFFGILMILHVHVSSKKMRLVVLDVLFVFSIVDALGTVQRETFEGENFRKFRGFVAIFENFLRNLGA